MIEENGVRQIRWYLLNKNHGRNQNRDVKNNDWMFKVSYLVLGETSITEYVSILKIVTVCRRKIKKTGSTIFDQNTDILKKVNTF